MSYGFESDVFGQPMNPGGEAGVGTPAFGVTGANPASPYERRTELRNPELAHMPLGQVVEALTQPSSIDAQVDECMDRLRHYPDPYSPDALEAHDEGELMLSAQRRHGRRLFIGSAGDPEIDVVRRGLEDAPRSEAYAFDYDLLKRAEAPEAAVLVKGEVFVRPGDFVLPKGGLDDDSMAKGYREMKALATEGHEPAVHATAVVTPDGSVVYVYRDGNIPLSAIASLSQPIRLSRVEVINGDPADMSNKRREADYRARTEAVEAFEAMPDEEQYPSSAEWGAGGTPSLRRQRPQPRSSQAFVSWFVIPPPSS